MPNVMENPSLTGSMQPDTPHGRPDAAPSRFRGIFHVESAEIDNAVELVRLSMREDLYAALQAKRVDTFNRNEILLKAANINDHSTEHQDRDTYMVKRIFEAFADKLDYRMLEPVLAGSMVHDREYIPAARRYALSQVDQLTTNFATLKARSLQELAPYTPVLEARELWNKFLAKLDLLEILPLDEAAKLWSDHSFPEQIGKHELDPHAELGAEMMQRWYEHPEMAQYFEDWNSAQREAAIHTIRDHSNGSDYDPFMNSLESQILRLADKLDNTHRRVPEYMLTEECLTDPNNCHRYVPAAIQSQALIIDRDKKVFTVEYMVDTAQVEALMRRSVENFTYTKQQFVADFQRAYGGKSMRIAAEVADKLFAENGKLYADDAAFQVRLKFTDGTEEVHQYKRMPTAPTFS